ncbi:hypothetical protein FD754_010589 [Muntiacus muntjak]|uniref:CN hydrolase domain-containing protein n=1 Tax=Muntiacus muntjak TaxID=9888 RepID=A0A5N3WYF1_MUNMU|nr:hypothetical protein FD754_010589 [Muntiacus muntjak]
MIISYFPKYVAILVLFVLRVGALDTFLAAVFEYAVILPNRTETPVLKEAALLLMIKNIDVLEKALKLAVRQDAHIIVTLEDGIYGRVLTGETIYPYLEDIPDPEANWIPCRDPRGKAWLDPFATKTQLSGQGQLIYIVANIGDKNPFNASDPQCPPDGHYQYNTDVVFNFEGRLLARYHKQFNLFAPEVQFDLPKDSEHVTPNTPFGTLGIFTCFDILSHGPAAVVVEEFRVDSTSAPRPVKYPARPLRVGPSVPPSVQHGPAPCEATCLLSNPQRQLHTTSTSPESCPKGQPQSWDAFTFKPCIA